MLAGTALALVISVAAPVLLSRDVFSYAAYARIDAVHHQNPYVAVPIAFRRDPFVADTAAQWLHARSVYGPAFTLASEGMVRPWRHSPNSLILAFKVAAGLGVAMAVACTTLAAKSARPERAPVAAALVGLNPVIVVHTVGGAHVDAWLAGLLAGALALAVRPRRTAFGAGAVTVLLTAASLIKIVALPALVLWLWQLARTAPPDRRARAALPHAGLVLVLTAATVAPFADGWRTLTPLATTGGLESWASPAHFVAHGLRGLVELVAGAGAGRFVEFAVLAFFLFGFVAVFIRMARRDATVEPGPAHPAGAWGPALLLLALSLPYLLPWYAAWFVPFLGLLTDGLLMGIGTLVSVLLALTLVPADPFHGTTTPGVMIWVHDVIAPAMLVSLVVAVRRVWKGPTTGSGEGHSAAPLGSWRRWKGMT